MSQSSGKTACCCSQNQGIHDYFAEALRRCSFRGQHQYKFRLQQALDSVRKFPLPLTSKQEAMALQGIGPGLAQQIEHLLNSNDACRAQKPRSESTSKVEKRSSDSSNNSKLSADQKSKYTPRMGSPTWILLVSLQTSQALSSNKALSKAVICTASSGLHTMQKVDEAMVTKLKEKWTSTVKAAIDRGLVQLCRDSFEATYYLTSRGHECASRLCPPLHSAQENAQLSRSPKCPAAGTHSPELVCLSKEANLTSKSPSVHHDIDDPNEGNEEVVCVLDPDEVILPLRQRLHLLKEEMSRSQSKTVTTAPVSSIPVAPQEEDAKDAIVIIEDDSSDSDDDDDDDDDDEHNDKDHHDDNGGGDNDDEVEDCSNLRAVPVQSSNCCESQASQIKAVHREEIAILDDQDTLDTTGGLPWSECPGSPSAKRMAPVRIGNPSSKSSTATTLLHTSRKPTIAQEKENSCKDTSKVQIPPSSAERKRDWEVVLLIDKREKQYAFLEANLVDLGVPCEVCQLSVGDYAWVAREKSRFGSSLDADFVDLDYDSYSDSYDSDSCSVTSSGADSSPMSTSQSQRQSRKSKKRRRDEVEAAVAMLDCIVERKTVEDLASSICDGRYAEQKQRLLSCGVQNVVYLLEGLSMNPSGVSRKTAKQDRGGFSMSSSTILTALVNTQVNGASLGLCGGSFRDASCSDDPNMHVVQTRGLDHTAFHLMVLHRQVEKRFFQGSSVPTSHLSLLSFQRDNQRKVGMSTTGALLVGQLRQVPGVSSAGAEAIAQRFGGTFARLFSSLQRLPPGPAQASVAEVTKTAPNGRVSKIGSGPAKLLVSLMCS